MKSNENGKRKHLYDAEIKKLLGIVKESLDPRGHFVFSLMLFLGLRVQEACNIRCDDIDEVERTITIKGLKSGRLRTYDMPRIIWQRYRAWMSDRSQFMPQMKDNPYLFPSRFYKDAPLTTAALKSRFQHYVIKAELGHFSIHSLRHSCAMKRVKEGASAIDVMKWLRHRSMNSTVVYFEAFEAEGDCRRAAKEFEGVL